MIDTPIRKKMRNYPKDFTPPAGFFTSRKDPIQQTETGQQKTPSSYASSTNRHTSYNKINLNRSTQLEPLDVHSILKQKPHQKSQSKLFTLNPQQPKLQPTTPALPDSEHEYPILNSHLTRKQHYINPELLARPRIQEDLEKDLVEIQNQQNQGESTPGSIKKNVENQGQKPLQEGKSCYVEFFAKNGVNAMNGKVEASENTFNQSLRSQFNNFENIKDRKMNRILRSGYSQPQFSHKLLKRSSDSLLFQSHLQTSKQKQQEKQKNKQYGYLMQQKKLDKIKAHINQIAFQKVRNKQKIGNVKQTEPTNQHLQQNQNSFQIHQKRHKFQSRRPASNFKNGSAYPQFSQNFSHSQPFSFSQYPYPSTPVHLKISLKTPINNLHSLLHFLSSQSSSSTLSVSFSIPKPLLSLPSYLPPSVPKQSLYSLSLSLFASLSLPIDCLTVHRYSNCILIVNQNVALLWKFRENNKIYVGGWKNKYFQQGEKDGLGMEIEIEGEKVYYGQWRKGKKWGIGVMRIAGQIWAGEWVEGKRGRGWDVEAKGYGYGNKVRGQRERDHREVDPFQNFNI